MNVLEIEELRGRGLSSESLFPDATIIDAEQRVWAFIELFCNQFFEPRVFSDTDSEAFSPAMCLDGNGRSYIRLPVPIITLSGLIIDSTTVDVADVIAYNRIFPDDRRNPKLSLQSGAAVTSFRSGEHNINISGVFGYVDGNSRPPSPLLEAARKLLLIEMAPLVGSPGYKVPKRGKLISEMSDDYMYKMASGQTINGATGVPEIDRVLFMYRRDDFIRGRVV